MKSIYLFIFIPVFTFSQNPANLFPHHVGDVWQYIDDWGHYWTRTVVKDSVDSDYSHHIFFEHTPDYYIRSDHYVIDTLNQVWGYVYDSLLFLYYKLEADSGEIYYSGSIEDRDSYTIVKDVGTGYFFGKERFYKEFVFFGSSNPENYPYDALESSNAILVDSIGWVYSWYEVDAYHILQGCIINGKQYGTITYIADHHSGELPKNCRLLPAYPNPFNPQTRIQFEIPLSQPVILRIYDISGREVKTLINGPLSAGAHSVIFDGSGLASGIYFCRLQAGSFQAIKKITLLK